jgi:tetratricopeptide (TPR) repeat protein
VSESIIPAGIEAEGQASARLSADLATSHALDIAMHDPEGPRAAAAFLASHKTFVDLQIAYFHEERALSLRAARIKHVSDIFRVVAQAAFIVVGLAVASGVVALWWSAITTQSVIVNAFQAPASLAAGGLQGTVVAGKVLDALLTMQDATQVAAARRRITGAWSDAVEIRLPETGLSLAEISNGLRRLFGHDLYIDGALVRTGPKTVSLTIRGDGIAPASFSGSEDDIDMLARQAAEYVFARAQPILYASYLLNSSRLDEGLSFIRNTFPRVSDVDRAALANLWGETFLSLNQSEDAASRFRLALQFNPHDWRAWNNLIGVLGQTESEEAAYRSGIAMKNAASGILFGSRPTLYDYTNLAQLTLDPGAVIAGLLADRRVAQREGAEYDLSSWIAEQEAVRHDWAAVAQYLLESPVSDVTTPYDEEVLGGLRAIEAGNDKAAVGMFEAADKLWHASPVLQAYFPDSECNLGHAYALVGRMADALAFLSDPRFVRCRAFLADAIDRTGSWQDAEHAYRHAEAVAPDLAFAYAHEGMALLRHGRIAEAMARLKIAHHLSPHWADPLKTEGDAFAAEGKWGQALHRYRQALRWAPGWTELQAARAAAAAKAGS